MHGNVAEWTLDEYQPDAYAKLGTALSTPRPPSAGRPRKPFPRVIRGGSWYRTGRHGPQRGPPQIGRDEEWKLSDPNIPLSPWWYTEEAAQAVGMRIMRPLKPLSADEKKRVWEADVDDLRQDVRDRLREGRGALGVADETLPAALKAAEELDKDSQR